MNITPKIHKKVAKEMQIAAKKIGVKNIPDYTLEVISLSSRRKKDLFYGFHHLPVDGGRGFIAFDVKRHPHWEALRYTIYHEMVHEKYPDMNDGKKFDKIVDRFI